MHADEVELEGRKEDVDLDTDDTPAPGARRRKTDDHGRHLKGRGFTDESEREAAQRYAGKAGEFMEVDGASAGGGALKSIEGWIVFVSGVHEEASEDDILDKFSDAGEVKNVQLPLDRRTGFVKGYALIEYDSRAEAEVAIRDVDNTDFNGQTLHVSFAFQHPSRARGARAKRGRR